MKTTVYVSNEDMLGERVDPLARVRSLAIWNLLFLYESLVGIFKLSCQDNI